MMKAVYQNYIGTTDEWMSADPRLYDAVVGIEVTTDGRRLIKIGNGKDRWQNLEYVDAAYITGLPEALAALSSSATFAQIEENSRRIAVMEENYGELKKLMGYALLAIDTGRQAFTELTQFVELQHGPLTAAKMIVVENGSGWVTESDVQVVV
jgi:hypothetical protein